jgi:hypothetical protein
MERFCVSEWSPCGELAIGTFSSLGMNQQVQNELMDLQVVVDNVGGYVFIKDLEGH